MIPDCNVCEYHHPRDFYINLDLHLQPQTVFSRESREKLCEIESSPVREGAKSPAKIPRNQASSRGNSGQSGLAPDPPLTPTSPTPHTPADASHGPLGAAPIRGVCGSRHPMLEHPDRSWPGGWEVPRSYGGSRGGDTTSCVSAKAQAPAFRMTPSAAHHDTGLIIGH